MTEHLNCLIAIRQTPDQRSASALRRLIAQRLCCSPFSVRLIGTRRAAQGLLMFAHLPPSVVASAPRGDRSIYVRALPRSIAEDSLQRMYSILARGVSQIFEKSIEKDRQLVFLGRPLVVAAERNPDFVKLFRFARSDWETFAAPIPANRALSYALYMLAQSVLADLLRLFGRRVRLELGSGYEIALGDAVGK